MSILIILLFLLLLFTSKSSLYYASLGLTMWFQNMVPALFPFMVLSGIIVRQNYTEKITFFIHPLFRFLFGTSKAGSYVILCGFLCGFPMGAKTCADLYRSGQISKAEADYLLAFCNQLSPAYYFGFLLPFLKLDENKILPFILLGIYGIPIGYGLLLSPYYRKKIRETGCSENTYCENKNFLESIQKSISDSVSGITILGAYMILCNVCMILPLFEFRILQHLGFGDRLNPFLISLSHMLLEINGGIKSMGTHSISLIMGLLPFGALSCILQTKYMIRETDLSIGKYLIHKTVQTVLSIVYFFFLRL